MSKQYIGYELLVRLKQVAWATVVAAGTIGAAHAQLPYPAANTVNTAGAYADLGGTGTAIATPNTDDANSAATPIGFTFTFNGTAFTDFVLNTNGFIKLGTAAPAGPQYTDGGQSTVNGPVNGADTNLLLPFNQDLTAGSAGGTEYRVATTGTAPNRVCTIQWKNVSDKARPNTATQYANFSFQAKLYETSNQIEFVYGTATAGAAGTEVAKFATVGLKGNSTAANQVVLGTKASTVAWSGTVFAAGLYTGNAHNVRTSVLPDPGRTYRFSVQVANDVAASSIQGYGSIAVPAGNPFTIRGVVRNAGNNASTATTATLTIGGANTYSQTQSVASLALGASGVATFSGISLPNVGQNTVTLSVSNDGNNGNNSVSQPMETSATTFSFATPNGGSAGSVFTAGDNGYYAAKITLSAPRSITSVNALISEAGTSATSKSSIGESVYGVVVNAATGEVLGRSANYVITAADINAQHTFTLTSPVTVPAGDVLIGMAQVASPGAAFYPFGLQGEEPTRPNTFYTGSTAQVGPPAEFLNTPATSIFKFPFGAVTAAPANNDLAVSEIQGYGSIAVPVGNPFGIRAVVRNTGIAPLGTSTTVTLAITGANTLTLTQTLPSLAVGATSTVSFANISLPNVGQNTVTVTVPNDDNSANNAVAQPLATSATTFSFITPGLPQTGSFGFTPIAAARTLAFCGKFTVNTPRDVTAVRAVIGNDADLVPNAANGQRSSTVYGVVLNATTGALIARSPDYVVTAADLGQLHTFNLSGSVPTGDFLVGLAQVLPAGTGADAVFPMAYQAETPARTGLFFTANLTVPGAPTEAGGNNARYMLEAETAAPATCLVPTNFAVTGSTGTSVSFSFTAPASGATGYQIVYGPQGFTPGAGSTTATFTGTTYTLTGLTAATAYDFYIRTICSGTDQSALVGPVRAATSCIAPTISAFPYSENFDVVTTGQTLPCGITVSDTNGDGFTWQPRSSVANVPNSANIARSAPNAMVYVFNSNDVTVGANDWFYTPALTLSGTQRYRLSFYYRGPAAATGNPYTNALEVKYGASATPAGQTTTLFTNNAIASATYSVVNNTGTPVVADLTPASGTFYVGFHATSAADQGFLAVDDVMITAGPLATSEALKRAVSVFPNPSATGVFNLEIHGANAKKALNVEVTNMLGQRVYAGTAKDNLRTALDLSKLASGIYNIKVRNGEEYTMQQISIVK